MNPMPSDNGLGDVVKASLGAVDVPPFDLRAIQTRAEASAAIPRARPAFSRRALVAVPAGLVLAALLINIPAVRAQMERALRAFAVVNGQAVALTVRTVSLDQARAQMPFQVIPPAGVPAGIAPTIRELYSETAPADARLMFEYRRGDQLPALTISESSARSKGPLKLMLSETHTTGGPGPADAKPNGPPEMPSDKQVGGAGGESNAGTYMIRNVEVRSGNGVTTTRKSVLTPGRNVFTWTVRGTRIILAAPDGSLTPRQIEAIRIAMSR